VAVHGGRVDPVDAGNRADGSWAGLSAPRILGYDIPLEAAATAHRIPESRHTGGKIVLDVAGS